jgi:hypothetical protein
LSIPWPLQDLYPKTVVEGGHALIAKVDGVYDALSKFCDDEITYSDLTSMELVGYEADLKNLCKDCHGTYGEVFDTENILGRGKVPEFLWAFDVVDLSPWVSGCVSY